MRRPPSSRLAVAVAALALVAGCGGNEPSGPRHSGSSDQAVSLGGPSNNDGEDAFAHGPVTIQGAVKGGTVRVLVAHAPSGSLDPTRPHPAAVTSLLSRLVVRSLTQWRYNPATRVPELVGDLATDDGSHTDDYTSWRFRIRPHTVFEDGTPVTPGAIVRGIQGCLKAPQRTTSPCHRVPIRQVAHRGHDLRIDLDRPDPELPYQVASPAFGPLPGRTEGAAPGRRPLATGPYRIAAFRPGHRLVLVRNNRWDASTDAGRTDYPTRFVVQSGRMTTAQIARLIRADHGTARTSLTYDAVPLASPGRRQSQARRLVFGPTPCTTYLAPEAAAFADPQVRRALVWAYPYRAMLRDRGLTRGATAVPAATILPPLRWPAGGWSARPAHVGFATSARTARSLLSRAGALGTTVRIRSDTDPALRHALTAAGYTPELVRSGPVDLRTRTVCAQGSLGEAWLRDVYADHPTVQRRLRHIEGLPLDQQPGALALLDRDALRRHWWVVPLWYDGVAMAHGSRIRGMVDDPGLGMPAWSDLWVSP